MPTPPLPAAVLWDMDGTLVDTEPDWMAAEIALLGRFGRPWTHAQALTLVGSGLQDAARVLQDNGAELDVPTIVDTLTDSVLDRLRERVPWRPGALELLAEVRDAGVPTALVTMSIRRMAETVARAIPFPAFDLVVSGSDVAHPKPHPDPYQRAAAGLGVDIRASVAIEDSAPGLASAVAAGAAAIGVPATVPLAEGDAWTLWPTLRGRTLGDLAAVTARTAARA
ncbi:HAD family phosphatase [Amnibacterium sp.]|uniref:HAD family hydrolase n=1 Tax=Amnibacterium sp. TaxID=1872496 RepID=UPI002612E31A|nr:HAD family phosphatase [Amnibacterium sp.]MCU1473247.1 putative phosphatase [Amnibacterium sp.]